MSTSFTRRRLLRRTALGAAVLSATLVPLGASAVLAATEYTESRFSITIDGYEIASFSERVEPADASQPTLAFKRGKTSNMEMMWAWHEAARNGLIGARRDVDVVLYNMDSKPVARYHLEMAWPAKIEIGTLKAGASEVLMETVTIVAERIQRVSV